MNTSDEELFQNARAKAALHNLVTIRPDGQYLLLPAMKKTAVAPSLLSAAERLMPSNVARSLAVIGDTGWATSETPSLEAANKAVPFFGLLMGLASIGHSVWLFNGTAIEAGCREADVLIVDDASLARLPDHWQTRASRVMRNPQILVHDRASFKLRNPNA